MEEKRGRGIRKVGTLDDIVTGRSFRQMQWTEKHSNETCHMTVLLNKKTRVSVTEIRLYKESSFILNFFNMETYLT